MSSVNYSLKNKGVRLIPLSDAWIKGKNGKYKKNPKYKIIGKVDTKLPNFIISPTEGKQPKFKGDVHNLNSKAKSELISYFYDANGKRNNKKVAYLGIEKNKK